MYTHAWYNVNSCLLWTIKKLESTAVKEKNGFNRRPVPANVGKTVWIKSPSEDQVAEGKSSQYVCWCYIRGQRAHADCSTGLLRESTSGLWSNCHSYPFALFIWPHLFLCGQRVDEAGSSLTFLGDIHSFVILGFGVCSLFDTESDGYLSFMLLCYLSDMQKPSQTILCKILHVPWQSNPFLYMIYPWRPCVIWAVISLTLTLTSYFPHTSQRCEHKFLRKWEFIK